VAIPTYDGKVNAQSLPGIFHASEHASMSLQINGGSLLALVFNRLWCQALNERKKSNLTHFAMHHADIEAPPGWLDSLLVEQQRVGADVLSVVIPIKDNRGITSTGIRDPEKGNVTRFTMKQIMEMPETFDISDTGFPGRWLMVNTGLWVCDFTRPWVEKVCFSILDATVQADDGTFKPQTLPEDWNFSGFCAREGLKVFATRKVPVTHHGNAGYDNQHAWGEWAYDRGD
jgi:hypothetical protein